MSKTKLNVNELEIVLYKQNEEEFISLTDMAKFRDSERSDYIIQNWMRTRSTVEFLGLWEQLNNPNFNSIEFDGFRNITEYQRLKEIETNQYNLEWNVKRILSKTNYHIHTDAVKNYILPDKNYEKDKEWIAYAEEADLLNVALFNCTAKDWREANPDLVKKSMNIRDIASINELAILSNLETLNAEMIKEKITKRDRFRKLHEIAKYQLSVLKRKDFLKTLKKLDDSIYIEQKKRPKN